MKVVSLLDIVEIFNAKETVDYINCFKELSESIDFQSRNGAQIEPDVYRLIQNLITAYGGHAKLSGLPVTYGLTKSLVIEMMLLAPADLSRKVLEIHEVHQIEIASHQFLYLNPATAQYVFKSNPFGDEVAKAFPSAAYDLEEACTCYAIGRSTACVFHLMRVLEVLFKCLQVELGINATYTTWGNYLADIAKANRAKNTDKNSEVFLYVADIESQLWAIKNAWRDNMIHSVAAKYTESEAKTIFTAVEGVMVKAAQKLKETP